MKTDFNPFEWQHGYAGAILILLDFFWWHTWAAGILGALLVIDELTQVFIFGQHGGLFHRLARPLYKLKIVKWLMEFLDKLMGKLR